MDTSKIQKIEARCNNVLQILRSVFDSAAFSVFETLFAVAIVAFGVEVAGAVAFVALLSVKLIVCEDVLSTTLPFLLLSAFVTNCYNSYNTFIAYLPVAPVPIACLLYHFVIYAKPAKTGESVYGILFVTIAVMLGGIGGFALMRYVKGAYYIFGLGAGMIVAYYLMKSQFSVQRPYDIRERFSFVMTLLGVLSVAIIALGYFRWALGIKSVWGYQYGFSRNNISTFLMFAMPFPLYLARKKQWFAVFTALIYGALCVSTSRGGLLFGSVEFLVCCVYWIYEAEGKHKFFRLFACVGTVVLIAGGVGRYIWDIIHDRILVDGIIQKVERYKMLWQAFDNFASRPIFGTGILDDSISYGEHMKKGAMCWYHMMIPQIIGSMGLVGVAAYLAQGVGRIKLIFTKPCMWSLCLGISYLGILLMSQVNPGEFCPIPFELLTVLLFIFQENRLEAPQTAEFVRLNGKIVDKYGARCYNK